MVNTALLENRITKSGKKKTYLAEKCGITRQSFRSKCSNTSEFTASQVMILCEELEIKSLTERDRIFFAREVANSGNF